MARLGVAGRASVDSEGYAGRQPGPDDGFSLQNSAGWSLLMFIGAVFFILFVGWGMRS